LKRPHESSSTTSSRHSNKEPVNSNASSLEASMLEQEKFMQEMMNLSQLASSFPNNPFGAYPFGGGSSSSSGGFQTPSIPTFNSSKKSNNKQQQQQVRSPSPSANGNAHDRSISPASSIASNMSQQQQQSLDFNMFMTNLMNYQMLSGSAGAANSFQPPPPLPPPLLSGLPSMPNDLSKLPVDFLAALASASQNGASNSGLSGLDPNLFSALAQLNSFSNNMHDEDAPKETISQKSKNLKPSSSSSSKSAGYQNLSSPHQSKYNNNNINSAQVSHSNKGQTNQKSLIKD